MLKFNRFSTNLILVFLILVVGCKSKSNDEAFLKQVSGRYLYSVDEIIKVYSNNNQLLIDWRGAKGIIPLKTGENIFFIKEMNSKIQFLINPEDKKEYLVFLPKNKNETIEYKHKKLTANEKTPSEYLMVGDYKNALKNYLKIQQKDSLNPIIKEHKFNNEGYYYLRNNKLEQALNTFKINTVLYPESDNVYDSYAEALAKSGDTINAIINYKKSLSLDSGNRHAKRRLEKLQNKGTDKTN